MSGRPVVQSSFEYRIWKMLDSKAFTNGGPLELCRDVEAHEGTVNSAVLVMLMDELVGTGEATADNLRKLVSKSRATDCLPSVRACEIMLDKGDADAAEEMLGMSAGSRDAVPRMVARARILSARGDLDGARDSARSAYGYDPACRGAYRVLAEADPDGGWPQRENIQDVMEGAPPTNPAGTGRMQLLFSIYYDWFTGRRSEATEDLIASEYYKGRDPEFLLASARMSVDEKDWHSASMVYSEILGMEAPPFVYAEAAEAALGGGEPARALNLLSKADGRSRRVQKDVVCARMHMDERGEMLEALRILLDNETSGSDEYVNAVRFLIDRGLEREAETVLDRYSRYSGDDSDTLTMRSVMFMRSGDYISARRMAARAVREDRRSGAAKAQLARMLHLVGRDDRAERECAAVLSSDPGNADALILLRDIHVSRGDHAKAAGVCRQMLEACPDDAAGMLALAHSLAMSGDREAASEQYRRALRADGSKGTAEAAVSSMVECGMYRDAEAQCKALERQFPRDALLRRLKGNAQYALGRYLEASVSFAEAAEMDPHNPVLWHSKGMADEARGDLESAADAYGHALMLDQGVAEYWISRAVVQERTRDRHGALESLNRAMELDHGSVQALMLKARILSASSKYADALYFVREARVLAPGDVRIMDAEASLLVSASRPEEASEVLKRRLATEASSDASLRLSRLLLSGGDPDGALSVLERALAVDPGSEPLSRERDRIAAGRIGPKPEPEPAPEPEPRATREDPEALRAMSASLLGAGDLKGAMRMVDRALAVNPGDSDLSCLKARIALESGDFDGAALLASNALKTRADHAGLHAVVALALEGKGELEGALSEMDTAIACGMDTARVRADRARILEGLGRHGEAAAGYAEAVVRNPGDMGSLEAEAVQLLAAGRAVEASAAVEDLLRRDPHRVSAVMLSAEISASAGDDAGLLAAYGRLVSCRDVSDDDRVRMVRMLEEAGHRDEARALMGGRVGDYSDAVKRYAEKVLRRAYTTRTSADDPDILDALGLDPDTAEEVARYISEKPDAPHIVPGKGDFEAMERLSHEVVMKLRWADLEGEPLLPLEKVYVVGGFREADSAKALVAYVHRAMFSPVPSSADPRLTAMSDGLPRGMSVYEVMRNCDLGVFEARIVASLAV